MELNAVRSFDAVAQSQSLSRAARQVHLAQPALSRRVHALEQELGVSLLTRHAKGVALRGQWETLERLRDWGLRTNPASRLCDGLGEVLAFCEAWREKRDSLEYDIDGVVVKVDDFALQRELGFTNKRDIEAYGIDRFVEQCKARVQRFADRITDQSKRLGYWMDWDHSYFTNSDDNNYTIWRFLQVCHERGLLYRGHDVMPWCPRCGTGTERIENEWGKRCPECRYEHFPHLHPATIVLVRDGDRVLLTRKAEWAPGRYALIAGFVDNGESLEGCVAREIKEEVGVDVTDVRYVGSQNWPFPSQMMIGFVATYAGGDIVIDREELLSAFPNRPVAEQVLRQLIDARLLTTYEVEGKEGEASHLVRLTVCEPVRVVVLCLLVEPIPDVEAPRGRSGGA